MASSPETSVEETELLRRARTGDSEAIETLYVLHIDPARRLASVLAGQTDGEELVADAFARVIAQLRGGRGPSLNFRAYLFTTIRNRFHDARRLAGRENLVSDQPWVLEDNQEPVAALDETLAEVFGEHDAIAAFGSLPESWQKVLWHVEVEGRPVPEVAKLLRTTPQAVSSLAYRAREGLRVAYLSRRLPVPSGSATARDCRWTLDRLGQYVRGGLSSRAVAKIDAHLDDCPTCTVAMADLADTNRKLAGLFLPVVLVGGATGFAGVGEAPAGPSSGGPADGGMLSRTILQARRVGTLVNGPVAAVVTTAAVAAAAGVGWWATSDPAADSRRNTASSQASTSPDGPGRGPTLDGWTSDIRVPLGDLELPPRKPTEPVAFQPPVEEPAVVEETSPQEEAPAPPAAPPAPPAEPSAPPVRPPAVKVPPGKAAPVKPRPTRVTPVAPTATAVPGCGSYGTLTLPSTTGITYTLTQGDGQQGPWTVTAAAGPGYAIATGAPTTFSGDLGTYYPCPVIVTNGKTLVDPAADEWDITADVSAAGPASYLITVEFRFDGVVFTRGDHGLGWDCWATDGTTRVELPTPEPSGLMLQPGAQWIVCEFDYTGTDPVGVTVPVVSLGSPPAGTATVSTEGTVRDTKPF